MKLKRLTALCTATVMATIISLTPVSAANTSDTMWSFNIEPGRQSYTTSLREKTNTSGTYVYYKEGTPTSLVCDVLNSSNQSMVKKIAVINVGKKGLIAQYVYENGYRNAKLKVTSNHATYGGAGGVWSPDSTGNYPYIN